MRARVFVAGATGVIGRRLTALLVHAGHDVIGTTRSEAKAEVLRKSGVWPIVVDVMDADGLLSSMGSAGPEIVIHQVTDLPHGLDPSRMAASRISNARLRDEGTRNLVAAACATGARRLIAQSIAWAYAPGPQPYSESSPLDLDMKGEAAISVRGVQALESHVLGAALLEGIVLRYGRLYGPGTGFDAPPKSLPLHVDAAAYAAFLAMERGGPGVFNVAEPTGEVIIEKAIVELGWSPSYRLPPDLSEGVAA